MSTAAQLVSKCLAVRTAAHKSHLTTRSYATVPTGQPLEFIRELVSWLESNRGAASAGHKALENIVDNITALTARTIYKLEALR